MKIFLKLYKKILPYFFFIIYGKISINQNNFNKNLVIKKKKYKKVSYKFFEINNSRLYTNSSDVAYITNNTIISGPSIQFRRKLNANVIHNIVIHKGTPKFYKKINCRVFSLLCGIDTNNYYHWFFDCLPKLLIFKRFYKFEKNDFFLAPNLKHDFQIKSLRMLNIKNILNAASLKHVYAKKIITTSFTNFTIDHKDWLIKELRDKFTLTKRKISKQNLKIFLDRKGVSSLIRDISNKEELIKFLRNENFLIIDPSKLSFVDEIKLFNAAKIVVGIYGAGLTNAIFCQKKTHIIELKNNQTDSLFKNIIKKSKLNYHFLTSEVKASKYSSKPFDGFININILKLSKILSKIN